MANISHQPDDFADIIAQGTSLQKAPATNSLQRAWRATVGFLLGTQDTDLNSVVREVEKRRISEEIRQTTVDALIEKMLTERATAPTAAIPGTTPPAGGETSQRPPEEPQNPALKALNAFKESDESLREFLAPFGIIFELLRLDNPRLTACFGLNHENLKEILASALGHFSVDFDEAREIRMLAVGSKGDTKLFDIFGTRILRLTPASPAGDVGKTVEDFKSIMREYIDLRDKLHRTTLGNQILAVIKEIKTKKITDPDLQIMTATRMIPLARATDGNLVIPAVEILDPGVISHRKAANQTKWHPAPAAPAPVVATPSGATRTVPTPTPAPTPTSSPATPPPAPVDRFATPTKTVPLLTSISGPDSAHAYTIGPTEIVVVDKAVNVYIHIEEGGRLQIKKAQFCKIEMDRPNKQDIDIVDNPTDPSNRVNGVPYLSLT